MNKPSWGRRLWHGTIFAMIGVVLINGAVTLQPMQTVLQWSEQLPETAPVAAPLEEHTGQITLHLEEYAALPRCRVLVNGEERACFASADAVVQVPDHALLEIDATYYNLPVSFTVTAVSDQVDFPTVGKGFQVQQGLVLLGEVRLKP